MASSIPRRVYLYANPGPEDSINTGATHDRAEAQALANAGALVVEYGKVGLIRKATEVVV